MRKKSDAGDYKRRSLAVVFFRKWFRIFLQVQKNSFGMAYNQVSVAQAFLPVRDLVLFIDYFAQTKMSVPLIILTLYIVEHF